MGGDCSVECIKECYFDEDINIRGNKIFEKINTDLKIENINLSEKEKQSLDECSKLLQEAENERIIISKKFELFLYYSGACVLTRPSMERGLISYLINILTQIYIKANDKSIEFTMKELYLSNFIELSKEKPYIKINGSISQTLKEKYDFELEKNKILKSGLDALKDLLSSSSNMKTILQNQLIVLRNIIFHSFRNKEMINHLKVSMDAMSFLLDFFNEITKGINEANLKMLKPKNMELYFKIAEDAAKNKINDPKEVVMVYANDDNCGSVDKWKNNMTYIQYHQMKF